MKGLLTLMLMAALTAGAADMKWFLLTDTGISIAAEKVGLLVAADDNSTFAVLANDGAVLAEGVSSIGFEQREDFTGIAPTPVNSSEPQLLGSVVSGELIVTGAKGTISIFAADGVQKLTTKAAEGQTRINVQGWAQGIYVIKCGKTAFKFIKK